MILNDYYEIIIYFSWYGYKITLLNKLINSTNLKSRVAISYQMSRLCWFVTVICKLAFKHDEIKILIWISIYLTNSSDGFTNLKFQTPHFFNDYLSWFLFPHANWEKKNWFWTNKKCVYFFNCSKWEKFVKQIGENIWWIG